MAADLVNVFECFNPMSFSVWLDSCKDKRKETIETLKSLKDLLKKETLEQIFKDFKEYVSETAGFDNQARYNQGRLIFEVASSFVGISEIKNALKGGNLALVVSETLKKAPKESLKIITSTKKITSKTAKEIIEEIKLVRVGKKSRLSWNGAKNIFKATDDEIAQAAERIKAHRIKQNAGTSGNYGYLEGKIGNITKNGEMVRSGAPDDNVIDLFEALYVDSKQIIHQNDSNGAWLRTTDSEYKILNRLANELGAEKGKIYPYITGELKIVSERAYCPSCQGVIQQFNTMFPNVKIILIDGAK